MVQALASLTQFRPQYLRDIPDVDYFHGIRAGLDNPGCTGGWIRRSRGQYSTTAAIQRSRRIRQMRL